MGSVLWNASGCNDAQNAGSGWYIKTDGSSCRSVLPGTGHRGPISNWYCDCLVASIHHAVMGHNHSVKREIGASNTESNECVANLAQIAHLSISLRNNSSLWRWVGGSVTTRAVTCCDIHIDGTAFGVQTRNRLSKPAMVPWYLRSVPMDGLAQVFVLRAQLQYIDLPQVSIIRSSTRSWSRIHGTEFIPKDSMSSQQCAY